MILWHLPLNLVSPRKNRADLMHLFLSGVFRRMAITMLSLFSPIYIYEILVSIGSSSQYAIVGLILYFFLAYIVKLLALNFSEDLSRKIGFKATIRLSAVPFLLFIFLLIYSSKFPILFVLTAVFWGIHTGLYWWGYHGYFIKSGSIDHFGESIGEAGFLETLAITVTPVVGAVVTFISGFDTLFVLSGLFVLIGLVLLGKNHDKRQHTDVTFGEVYEAIVEHKSVSLAYVGSGGEGMIYSVVWPLFLYLFFGGLLTLGGVVAAASLIAAVFSIFLGKWTDKQGEAKLLKIGAPLIVFSWLVKFIFRGIVSFVFADGIWNFGERMVIMPLNALSYKKAFDEGSAKAILFRETTLIFGVFIAFTTMAIWILIGGDLSYTFMLAAILGILPLVAVEKKKI